MEITRQALQAMRPEIIAALAAVGEKYGVTIKTGNATFTPDNFTMKIEGVRVGGKNKDALRYEASARMLGLPPLGTEFFAERRKFKTAGVNTTGTKVIVEREDGKKFLFPTDTCIALCNRPAPIAAKI